MIASEIRSVGSVVPAAAAAGVQIGTDLVLPTGTKWYVTFATATDEASAGAGVPTIAELYDSTNAVILGFIGAGGVASSTVNLGDAGKPIFFVDASDAAITLQARNSSLAAGSRTMGALFILQQAHD